MRLSFYRSVAPWLLMLAALAVRADSGGAHTASSALALLGMEGVTILAGAGVADASSTKPTAETDDSQAAADVEEDNRRQTGKEGEPQAEAVLKEVEVKGQRESIEIDPVRSRTTVTGKELERRQSDNVFDVLQDIPGVSVNGGPLANGMKFNIRGFSDTEDVLIKLDGAVRNFEKYRFGGGVFVEPELLKQVEVTRGPAGALQGSGAIGGVVSMQTKDARDLLAPGRRSGARVKTGLATNNRERLGSMSAYGVAFGSLDLLGNLTKRDSGNITTASGEELENSSVEHLSALVKAGYSLREDAALTLADVYYENEALEPFDATAGVPGLFGFVRRAIKDNTSTVNLKYRPAAQVLTPWINLKATLGYTNTSVADSGTQTSILAPATTNTFDYWITTLDFTNTSAFRLGPLRNALTYGVQYNRNIRKTKTVTSTSPGRKETDNLGQPSGQKANFAYVIEDRLDISDLSVTAGFRHDQYEVQAKTEQTRRLLAAEGRSPIIALSMSSPSAGVAYTVLGGPLTLFYNYTEAFRPPLVDEYFTQGPFSRCNRFFLGTLAPKSGICGDLYVPETSRNHEVGISLDHPGLFSDSDLLTAKAVYFNNTVENILESLSARTSGGQLCEPFNFKKNNRACTSVVQDGEEHLQGVEFELGYQAARWFSNLSLAAIRGRQICDGGHDLFDIPGDTLVFTLGRTDRGGRLQYGYRLRAVDERLVVTGSTIVNLTPCNIGLKTGTQDGYVLHNLFLNWQPHRSLTLDLAVENFTNTRYFLNNGFGGGIGQEAPGYDVRFSVSFAF